MDLRKTTPIDLASAALSLAEAGLASLPRTPRACDLHRRVAALRSILHGVVRDVLTPEQHRRVAQDAAMLMDEVATCRSRAMG
jgi:hypothetical protein